MNPQQVPPRRRAALALAAAGLLIGLGGVLHPRVDTTAEFDEGLAGMFESGSWVPSHLLTMAGFATAAMAIAALVRSSGASWSPRMRALGYAAAAATAFAAIESVPHLLAGTEASAVRAGDDAPLTSLHTSLQAISTLASGLTLAVLAVAGSRTRVLDGGRVPTALAAVGGVAFALAGPVIALTKDPSLSPLFAGSAGLAIWLLVCGVRTARRSSARTSTNNQLAGDPGVLLTTESAR